MTGMYAVMSPEGTVVAGLVHEAPPSPPLLDPLLLLVPLLLPLASPPLPPPELLALPLLEPVASVSAPLLEPLLLPVPLPPLLLLQPEAKEKEAPIVRIEVVMRMRRSMMWNSPWNFGQWARPAAATVRSVDGRRRDFGLIPVADPPSIVQEIPRLP